MAPVASKMTQHTTAPSGIISSIEFYVRSSEDNAEHSCVNVNSKDGLRSGLPVPGGVYDAHMGTTDNSWTCSSCLNTKELCPGHMGSIELNYPTQSPLFRAEILYWLRCLCFNCGQPVAGYVPVAGSKTRMLQEYHTGTKSSSKASVCVNCRTPHPVVSRDKTTSNIVCEWPDRTSTLLNHTIEEIFKKVSPETMQYFHKSRNGHPGKLILRTIPVPPNPVRPDTKRANRLGKGSQNEITSLLKTIIQMNESITGIVGDPTPADQSRIDIINMTYYELTKGSPMTSTSNHIINSNNQPIASIASRLPKKTGRIRGNIMGKRTGDVCRCVITCDSNIGVDEVVIPLMIARNIQIPETVQSWNRDRLQIYVNNKRNYPGCTKIKKWNSRDEYWNNDNLQIELEIGDIVMRDMITGDILPINRQPSLVFTNISAHRVRVLNSNSISINVSACNYYNADFDGDEMNGIIPLSIMSRIECRLLVGAGRWFVSYCDSNPIVGAFQDSLIGCHELTQSYVRLDKLRAMRMFMNTNTYPNMAARPMMSGREIVSELLKETPINLRKKAHSYKDNLGMYLNYNKDDIEVVIENGVLHRGVLDKSTMGQGRHGTVFHLIHNQYGAAAGFEMIRKFQKVTENYFYQHGFTVSLADMMIPESSKVEVATVVDKILQASLAVTAQLDAGTLLPPIGMTLEQFYEKTQLEDALNSGDDFNRGIFSHINMYLNGVFKLVNAGSKGNDNNMKAITGSIAQLTIAGKRMPNQFGYQRASPYFHRCDADPRARGFVTENYMQGVGVIGFIHGAQEGRYSMINNALNTSVTGEQSRTSIKNMESIITDNYRKSVKANNIIQCLYGEDGFDPSRFEEVKFPLVMDSDEKFISGVLESDRERLQKIRDRYREIFLRVESMYRRGQVITDSRLMPVNVAKIITGVCTAAGKPAETAGMPAVAAFARSRECLKLVMDFCANLPYVYMNHIQEQKQGRVPDYLKPCIELLSMMVQLYLHGKAVLDRGINEQMLVTILHQIKMALIRALMDSGCAVGTIAAQSTNQPLMQTVLDSKHRAGTTGSSLSGIIRIKEIFGAKDNDKMKAPTMQLLVKTDPNQTENEQQAHAQYVANHIEVMTLRRFTNIIQIFFESYGKIQHSQYRHENKLISEHESHYMTKPPNDITKWCVRLELNRMELIMKNMELETILSSLMKIPHIYVVNNSENSDVIVLRVYIRNGFKKTIEFDDVLKFSDVLMGHIIRGVKDLTYTSVDTVNRSRINQDGSVSNHKEFVIRVNGSNLVGVLDNTELDVIRSDTDSILEIARVYGIEAARQKLIAELKENIGGLNHRHYVLFGDEMTYTGTVTGIQKTGLTRREHDNVMLRASDKSPVQILSEAAVNGMVDNLRGLSAPLMVGKLPRVGTLYNTLIINKSFIEKVNRLENVIDEL